VFESPRQRAKLKAKCQRFVSLPAGVERTDARSGVGRVDAPGLAAPGRCVVCGGGSADFVEWGGVPWRAAFIGELRAETSRVLELSPEGEILPPRVGPQWNSESS